MSSMFTRRSALAAVLGGSPAGARSAPRRPNVLVILTDDQGWGDLSINGNTNLSTPHIDSIGRQGATFERFFVCAVCAPTRAEFLTGRYHARGGVRGVQSGQERLNLDERTVAQDFRDAGYATAAFGKWHNGTQAPYHPIFRGFQEFYGFTSGHWAHYFDTVMDHNGRLTRGKGYITDDLTNHALAFIEKNRRSPFFCYLPFNTPHSPMQVPDRFYAKFRDLTPAMKATDPALEDIGMTRAALAMVENVDWNVGRLLAALRNLGLENDTVVAFFADNGPNSWRWNGGMKGRKGSVDEGGLKSPLMMRWPGKIKPQTRVAQISGAIDLLPTLTDLAGVKRGASKPLDGRSVAPLLTGQEVDWPDRMIFSLQNKRAGVRTQQYRLDADGNLFDMEADPGQTRDVAGERPEVAGRLRAAVSRWRDEVSLGPDDRPYPVGHTRITYLPADEAVFSGGIKRSNRAPNSSYATNWRSTEDRITWDIEVARPGRYGAVLHYTAPHAGASIELSFGGAKIENRLREAHDPPAYGGKEDRHDRGPESYAKDFRPWKLGAIALHGSRGQLTLRATDIPGGSAAEVRYLVLTRLEP